MIYVQLISIISMKQEFIPVLSAAAAVSEGGRVLPGCACSWGVCLPGVCFPGGVCLPGEGGLVSQHALRENPPVNRMTDRCENITFSTSLRMLKIKHVYQRETSLIVYIELIQLGN